MVLQLCRHSG